MDARLGLVKSHITGRELAINNRLAYGGVKSGEINVYADIIEVRVKGAIENQSGGGPRGKIYGMSAGSRGRMLKRLARVRNLEAAWFLTLTYPNEFPEE